MHAENPTRVPMRTVFSHMAIPMVMAFIMALAYLGGLHKPAPHELPVAVVGPIKTAGPIAAQLQQSAGDKLDVRTIATPRAATDALQRLEISGAFIPSNTKPTLILASAGSDPASSAATKVFTKVAAAQGKPLTIQDVNPLPEDDPIGQNAFFFLVVLSIGSYATAISIAAAGASRRFRERLGLVIGAGIVIPTILLAAASVFFDMFSGHGAAIWALSVAYSVIVLGISVGLHTLVGRFSTLLFNALFVALNFTSSGGIFPTTMQPGFFGWLHSFWLGAGYIDVVNHLMYFPRSDVSQGVWILIGWGLLAIGSLALAHHVELRRRQAARFRRKHKSMEDAIAGARRDGLTPRQAMELELAEDVAV